MLLPSYISGQGQRHRCATGGLVNHRDRPGGLVNHRDRPLPAEELLFLTV